MNNEVWKPIVGYGKFDGRYEVSSMGRLRSVTRYARIRSNALRQVPGQIIRGFIDKNGYHNCSIKAENCEKHVKVHREVGRAFFPREGMENLQINHLNGNKIDNRVENLEWATCRENVQHALEVGLTESKQGCGNPGAKLTEEQVLQIRRRYIPGHRVNGKSALSREFGVCAKTVYNIIRNRNWSHL